MEVIKLKDDEDYQGLVDRLCGQGSTGDYETVLREKADATRGIVDDVRERGDAAVAEYTARFDGVSLSPDQFEVTTEEMDRAVQSVEPELLDTLKQAHENIRRFHGKNLRESWEETFEDGTKLGQRITPIESAGVYVPGGTAFYPSSVLMNIVPARVAGVEDIIMVSPPSYDGTIHPVVLAAARIAGATRVFRIGGAQAIAALAYGTERVPRVLKITGPGNTYVTAAKRLVTSICAIDTEAGPSEVTVIADESADPLLIAGELLAQAEHDPEACSVLITTAPSHVDDVQRCIESELAHLSRADIIRKSLARRGKIIVARSLDEATDLANVIAPEHLAIYTAEPDSVLNKIRNAAAIMVGTTTTVVMGDYFAGPNHILPTGRRARFASPLSAEDFRKVSSVISYSAERLKADGEAIRRFANAEALTAHARAIEIRQ